MFSKAPPGFGSSAFVPFFGLVNNLQTTGEQPIAKSGAI
ncbi:hypothetical protein SZ54_0302 [Rhizobium sp. UR51a]|nr:hypothetical protein SZ54_0302 [Rhizobium sp. UR51a]